MKAICKKWLLKNGNSDIENSSPLMSYEEIFDLFSDFNSKRLFQTSLASIHLKTINLYPGAHSNKQLKNHLKTIKQKIEKSSYLLKAYEGQKAVGEKSVLSKTVALTFSIALPIILIGNALLVFAGEVGLGNAIYVNRTDLEETGHLGAWPINAIEALSIAYFLHLWYLLNEGVFSIAKNAYKEELQTLQQNVPLHNTLQKIANQELEGLSSVCGQMKYRDSYKFKKL